MAREMERNQVYADKQLVVSRTAVPATLSITGTIDYYNADAVAAALIAELSQTGDVATALSDAITGNLDLTLDLSRLEFFLVLFVLYTVLGCLIESLGMIVITVPLIFPVLHRYGIDPIMFGVVLVLFVELGQISPPIGINLFVIQSIWDGKLQEVVLGTIPFHLIMFVVLAMVIFWPELALWLPAHMSAK